jgi:dolichol-phosphate mannosyltransferase
MDLTILIPAYKEAENLEIVIPKLKKSLEILDIRHQILVVDSAESSDDTLDVCNRYKVNYIVREPGNSYGDAIRSGIANASGEYLVIMDADGSHEPDFIRILWKYRIKNDVVIASRYIKGGSTENSKLLNFMSRILNISYRIILQLDCKDVSNSFKLYKSQDLKSLSLICNEFDMVEEILFKLKKLNNQIKIKEVPYTFKRRITGESKRNLVLFIFKYAFTLVRLRLMK